MKANHIGAIGLIAVGVVAPVRAIGSDQARSADVRFVLSQHGEVVVPVFIGGEGPYRFLLDTGSSHTVISQTLATTRGAPAVAKAPMANSVGSILAPVVRLPDVTVGSARIESVLATSLRPDRSGMLDERISGVLGQDFLSQFDYTLDYLASRLSWRDEGQVEKGVRLVLEPSNGRFLAQLPQDERCQCPLQLVPDSGANGLVLFAGRKGDRLRVDAAVPAMRLTTLTGVRTAYSVIVRALLIGPITLWDLPAARVVLPEGTAEEGDGLLPLSLFARVSFHHREGYMVVQPR